MKKINLIFAVILCLSQNILFANNSPKDDCGCTKEYVDLPNSWKKFLDFHLDGIEDKILFGGYGIINDFFVLGKKDDGYEFINKYTSESKMQYGFSGNSYTNSYPISNGLYSYVVDTTYEKPTVTKFSIVEFFNSNLEIEEQIDELNYKFKGSEPFVVPQKGWSRITDNSFLYKYESSDKLTYLFVSTRLIGDYVTFDFYICNESVSKCIEKCK